MQNIWLSGEGVPCLSGALCQALVGYITIHIAIPALLPALAIVFASPAR
ncbi:hypothetical protein [Undibacterium sp. RuTC16W]